MKNKEVNPGIQALIGLVVGVRVRVALSVFADNHDVGQRHPKAFFDVRYGLTILAEGDFQAQQQAGSTAGTGKGKCLWAGVVSDASSIAPPTR